VTVPIRFHFFIFIVNIFISTRTSSFVNAKLQGERTRTDGVNEKFSSESTRTDLGETSSASDDSSMLTTSLTKIVNGKDTQQGKYPYFVRLKRKEDDFITCGGVLIGPDIVLTAAHCNYNTEMSVGVNAHRKDSDQQEVVRTIVKRTVHPKYDPKTLENDFMVVHLNEPLPSNIIPVRIEKNENKPGTDEWVTAIGLGSVSDKAMKIPEYLQSIDVQVHSYEYCNRKESYRGAVKKKVMFCAGYNDNGQHRDACFGDSGGPMLNSKGELCGIISFGVGCGNGNFPGVYARASAVYDWIEKEACSASQSTSGGFLSCHYTPDPDPDPDPPAFKPDYFPVPAKPAKKSSDDFQSIRRSRNKKKRRERNASGTRAEPASRPRDKDDINCSNSPNTEVRYSSSYNGGLRTYDVITMCKGVGNDLKVCSKRDINSRGRISIWEVCPRECTSFSGCS